MKQNSVAKLRQADKQVCFLLLFERRREKGAN